MSVFFMTATFALGCIGLLLLALMSTSSWVIFLSMFFVVVIFTADSALLLL